VESGGDVAILAMDMNQNHTTLNTYYDGFGGGWRWGGGLGGTTTTVNTYQVGTLVVDLFDASTKKLIDGDHPLTPSRTIREEHQESRQGRAEDVRPFSYEREEIIIVGWSSL
jgi:hypothetical protein